MDPLVLLLMLCGVREHFLFTAYIQSSASLIGAITISKAANINQQKQLIADNIDEWKDVEILVIDEVSFMGNRILMTLNNRLMDIGNITTFFVDYKLFLQVTSANLIPSV